MNENIRNAYFWAMVGLWITCDADFSMDQHIECQAHRNYIQQIIRSTLHNASMAEFHKITQEREYISAHAKSMSAAYSYDTAIREYVAWSSQI